jgi:hypothetical protein
MAGLEPGPPCPLQAGHNIASACQQPGGRDQKLNQRRKTSIKMFNHMATRLMHLARQSLLLPHMPEIKRLACLCFRDQRDGFISFRIPDNHF